MEKTKETKMSEKKERKTTPVGEAKWAHIHNPKVAFVDEHGNKKGDPKYQIDVVFSKDDPMWAPWAKTVMENLRAMPEQIDKKGGVTLQKQTPIKRELDENDQPTGRFYVTFKTSDKFKPGVFDQYGKVMPETTLIGTGSKVRISYIENVYQGFGGGINFYLNAVQVVNLVEYKPQNAEAYGFPVESQDDSKPPDDDVPF